MPHRVAGLVTIAAAPDFTEDGYWANAPDFLRKELLDKGVIHVPSDYGAPYPITRRLITRVAVPSPTPAILQRLHAAGFGVVAMLPATDLAQGSFDAKRLQPGDMILVEGTEEESRSALDKLLATWPAYRTIAFLEVSRSLQLGVARAVRYGP